MQKRTSWIFLNGIRIRRRNKMRKLLPTTLTKRRLPKTTMAKSPKRPRMWMSRWKAVRPNPPKSRWKSKSASRNSRRNPKVEKCNNKLSNSKKTENNFKNECVLLTVEVWKTNSAKHTENWNRFPALTGKDNCKRLKKATAKEKIVSTLFQNVVSMSPSEEEETGSAGKQRVRNTLTDWNGKEGHNPPTIPITIPRNYVLENPFWILP